MMGREVIHVSVQDVVNIGGTTRRPVNESSRITQDLYGGSRTRLAYEPSRVES